MSWDRLREQVVDRAESMRRDENGNWRTRADVWFAIAKIVLRGWIIERARTKRLRAELAEAKRRQMPPIFIAGMTPENRNE